jgi:hypothetical protein
MLGWCSPADLSGLNFSKTNASAIVPHPIAFEEADSSAEVQEIQVALATASLEIEEEKTFAVIGGKRGGKRQNGGKGRKGKRVLCVCVFLSRKR